MKNFFIVAMLLISSAQIAQNNAIGIGEKLIFQGGINYSILYLTADANKVPIYAKFRIPFGNVELKIKSPTGLKN